MQKKLTRQEGEIILALYNEGKTGKEIGEQIGRSKNTVYDFFKRNGLKRGRGWINVDEAKFRRMWNAGVTYPKLKAEFGIRSNSVIARLRHKLGLPTHPRHNAPSKKYDDKELCRMIDAGVPADEICQNTGIGKTYLYHLVKKAGPAVKDEPRIVIPQDRLELRDRLYAAPYRDETGYWMGDPKVGFSALDGR